MKRYTPITLLLLCVSSALPAQHAVTFEEHELTTILNPWLSTTNAAGVAMSTFKNHGLTTLGYQKQKGDYHRAQEGNQLNRLDFFSERYDQIGKNWVVWGSFQFNMDTEKEKAWSDVIDTYNSSPYIFGSSIKAAYETQLFDMHVKLARKLSTHWAIGITADYKVGDVSRQRDPRTRSFLADFAGRPSVIYNIHPNHSLGLTAALRRKKEKMPSITTVQNDPNMVYYTMTGMEFTNATVAGFKAFQRQFVSSYQEGGFEYNYHNQNFNGLLHLGVAKEEQEILENQKQSPGSFSARHFEADLYATYQSDKWLLAAAWKNRYKEGSADEYLQELITTRDPETGITSQQWNTLFTYESRFKTTHYQSELAIDLRNCHRDAKDYRWLAGVKGRLEGVEKAYYMPTSTSKMHRAVVGVNGSYRIFRYKEQNMRITAQFYRHLPVENELQLHAKSLQEPDISAGSYDKGTYAYATNVLLPDYEFYRDKASEYQVQVQYNFPLQFKKIKIHSFVKASYSALLSDKHGNWTGGGITLGIIP